MLYCDFCYYLVEKKNESRGLVQYRSLEIIIIFCVEPSYTFRYWTQKDQVESIEHNFYLIKTNRDCRSELCLQRLHNSYAFLWSTTTLYSNIGEGMSDEVSFGHNFYLRWQSMNIIFFEYGVYVSNMEFMYKY